jgi:hypothetical protein
VFDTEEEAAQEYSKRALQVGRTVSLTSNDSPDPIKFRKFEVSTTIPCIEREWDQLNNPDSRSHLEISSNTLHMQGNNGEPSPKMYICSLKVKLGRLLQEAGRLQSQLQEVLINQQNNFALPKKASDSGASGVTTSDGDEAEDFEVLLASLHRRIQGLLQEQVSLATQIYDCTKNVNFIQPTGRG